MPAPRKEHRNRLAFLSAIKLPGLPAVELPWLRNLQSTIQSSVQSSAMPARVFVALGVMLSAAMPYWPYAHAWSWGLLVYFAVVMLLVVTGIWSAKLTWDARLPAAHTIALGVVIWSFGLIAAEAVPRIAFV